MAKVENEVHFSGKVAHKAVIEKDGKVLLIKAAADEFWDIPGGRINSGEKPAEALAREIKEELGVDIKVIGPFFTDLIRATKTGEEGYFVTFKVALADPTKPFVLDASEAEQIFWCGKDEILSTPMYEVCRDALKTHFGVK